MQGLWGIATIDHPAPVKTAAGVEANVGIDRCKKTGQHGVWPGEWKHGGVQHATNAWSKSLVPRDADPPKMKAPPLGERSLTKGRLGGGCGGPLSVNRTQKSNCWFRGSRNEKPGRMTGAKSLVLRVLWTRLFEPSARRESIRTAGAVFGRQEMRPRPH